MCKGNKYTLFTNKKQREVNIFVIFADVKSLKDKQFNASEKISHFQKLGII